MAQLWVFKTFFGCAGLVGEAEAGMLVALFAGEGRKHLIISLDSRTASAQEYLACTGPDYSGEVRIIRAYIEEAWDPHSMGI